jgi:very-short-patch-repair endonuclease
MNARPGPGNLGPRQTSSDSTTAFHADRRRDTALAALGFQTLRYTWDRVTGEPETVTAELRAVLTRRRPAGILDLP